ADSARAAVAAPARERAAEVAAATLPAVAAGPAVAHEPPSGPADGAGALGATSTEGAVKPSATAAALSAGSSGPAVAEQPGSAAAAAAAADSAVHAALGATNDPAGPAD
ncbi:hypothetical protein OSI44_25410, partial [Mycobacterium ulcerans]